VDLLYTPHGGGPAREFEAMAGLELHRVEPSRGLRRAAFYASKRLGGVPDTFARGAHPELLDATKQLLENRGHERIVAGDLSAAAILLPLSRTWPITYNAHNVLTAYERSRAGPSRFAYTLAGAFERRLLSRASESWMVSELDLQAARRLTPSARLRYVPNVVDVKAIEPVPARALPGRALLMVGDFLYEPNRAGRSFLIEEIMPPIWRHVPDARLTLVGRGLESWEAPDPRIEVAGFVEDLASAYRRCDCVVVPIREGGGTPLKFLEALAYGLPVIATPFAARGLAAVAGRHYREASDGASFADAVLGVLEDGAGEIAASGRSLAESSYSVEALARLIAA
jgi:glycosyltransferase involved in cell wall biosynthesis